MMPESARQDNFPDQKQNFICQRWNFRDSKNCIRGELSQINQQGPEQVTLVMYRLKEEIPKKSRI